MQNWVISLISIIIPFLSRFMNFSFFFFVYHFSPVFHKILLFRTKATNYASISFHKNKSKLIFAQNTLVNDSDYCLMRINLLISENF